MGKKVEQGQKSKRRYRMGGSRRVRFEQRLKETRGSHVDGWGETDADRENDQFKGPEAEPVRFTQTTARGQCLEQRQQGRQ